MTSWLVVPRDVCKNAFYFFSRDENIAFCEITGEQLNLGASYGMEIPIKFKFFDHHKFVIKLKESLIM